MESEEDHKLRTNAAGSQEEEPRHSRYDVDAVEPISLLQGAVGIEGSHNVNPLEALLGGGNILDIPPDADDDAMVELAIALSLQDPEIGGEIGQGQQVQRLANVLEHIALDVVPVQVPEAGHFSDTTASAAGSDDEGSTAATDGSTLRTSPAEQVCKNKY